VVTEHDLKPGDRAWYLPDVVFSRSQDRLTGDYPWAFGKRTRQRGPGGRGEAEGEVVELSPRDTAEHLRVAGRSPAGAGEHRRLVPLRPSTRWPAVVRSVNDDGTVNLDVASQNGGVTLHIDNLPVAPPHEPWSGHTCRAVTDQDEGVMAEDRTANAFARLAREFPAVPTEETKP
jgi:hypothetical protein